MPAGAEVKREPGRGWRLRFGVVGEGGMVVVVVVVSCGGVGCGVALGRLGGVGEAE